MLLRADAVRWVTCARLRSICTHWHLSRALVVIGITRLSPSVDQTGQNASWQALHELRTAVVVHLRAKNPDFDLRVAAGHKRGTPRRLQRLRVFELRVVAPPQQTKNAADDRAPPLHPPRTPRRRRTTTQAPFLPIFGHPSNKISEDL